jgi:aspartyl-tRNA(Asn)/glutamyl-tRNA(Gln) amidotransferase subunit B
VSDEMLAHERANLPELPAQVRERWKGEGLLDESIATLTQHPAYVRFVEGARSAAPAVALKKIANFVQTEVLRGAAVVGLSATFTVSSEHVGQLLGLTQDGVISGKQAKEVFAEMEKTQKAPADIVKERGMAVVSDTGAIETILAELIASNPKQVEGLRAGKKQLAGFFVGQVMKATGGSADPKTVNDLLEKLLSQG